MPITTLSPETLNASKAAALLAAQVRRDLLETKQFTTDASEIVAGQITAALIIGSFEIGGPVGVLAARLGR